MLMLALLRERFGANLALALNPGGADRRQRFRFGAVHQNNRLVCKQAIVGLYDFAGLAIDQQGIVAGTNPGEAIWW